MPFHINRKSIPKLYRPLIEHLYFIYKDVNEPPILTGFVGSVGYIEGNPPVVIDLNVGLSDADSLNFNTGTLTVSLDGYTPLEILSVENDVLAPGAVQRSGNDVQYSSDGFVWVTVGTVGVGPNQTGVGENLVITWNANSTPDNAEQVIERITYVNTNTSPVASRVATMTITDGDGGSDSGSRTINITDI